MTSPDQHVLRVGEAERALMFRLQGWGVDDAEDRARDFIRDLIRQGWSPCRPVTALPPRIHSAAEPPHELLEGVRTQLRAARPSQTEAEESTDE